MESQNNHHALHTKQLAIAALFTTLALIFSYIEAIIPLNIGFVGVKLGFANIVVLIALYAMNTKYAFCINMLRISIAGLLFSGLVGMLYSFSGGILSFATIYLLKKTNVFSIIGVSMAGGVMHNLGQLIIASFVLANSKLFLYLPVLLISGIISGIVIGIIAYTLLAKLPKSLFR